MDISEKAKKYADNCMLTASTSELEKFVRSIAKNYIEKAFVNGYEAGYADGKIAKENDVVKLVDGVAYIDLGLPSGTLWATGYLKDNEGRTVYMTYDEADKLNLPNEEQYKELIGRCAFSPIDYNPDTLEMGGYQMLSSNGKYVTYTEQGYYVGNEIRYLGQPLFWLKNEKSNEKRRKIAWLGDRDFISFLFMGYRAPVILVR